MPTKEQVTRVIPLHGSGFDSVVKNLKKEIDEIYEKEGLLVQSMLKLRTSGDSWDRSVFVVFRSKLTSRRELPDIEEVMSIEGSPDCTETKGGESR